MMIQLVSLIVSIFVLGVSPANAADSRYAGSAQLSGDHYVCTTHSNGKYFSAVSGTESGAEADAIHACLAGGGSHKECGSHVSCQTVDKVYPVPQDPDQNGDQDQDGDNGQQNPGQDPDQDDPDQDDNGQHDPGQDNGQHDPKHPKNPHGKMYYDWGRGMNGFGYCYAIDPHGRVMYNGMPQPNAYCERVRPSHFNLGRWNGYIYCFQWTPYMAVMNEGRAVPPGYCRY